MNENEKQIDNEGPKVLRTYTSDMAEVIRENEMSVIKIALAERKKREQEAMYKRAEGTTLSKTFLTIGSVILIVIAILGSYFLLQKKKEMETPLAIIESIETFISYDSKSYIDVTDINDNKNLSNIITNEQSTNSSPIKALFLTKKINNISEILTADNFLSMIGSTAPGPLTRSLSPKYLLGIYSNKNVSDDKDKSSMFLIFETTYYNQAYASMLDWEKTMLKDLYILFNINIEEAGSPLFEKPWKDIIINNRDARVLYGENNEELLYYIFINKNNFIITDNIEALREITTRFMIQNTSSL